MYPIERTSAATNIFQIAREVERTGRVTPGAKLGSRLLVDTKIARDPTSRVI
jgi:hypothetical protein